jgi:ferredoxin-NADP reductase
VQAVLIRSFELSPDVRHFEFEASGVAQLTFTPGQFVSLEATIDGKPITRAYSIASAPRSDNRFELCLNRVEGGHMSPHLFRMQPGDAITMSAPLGTFTLRDPAPDSIFIATGTGITPFRSILQSALPQGTPQLTLLFGVRHAASILYRDEFEAFTTQYPHFRFWPTLSRPTLDWAGRTGRVQAHLQEALGERRDIDVYLCGMKAMVDDVRATLKSLGFDRKQIRHEKYD